MHEWWHMMVILWVFIANLQNFDTKPSFNYQRPNPSIHILFSLSSSTSQSFPSSCTSVTLVCSQKSSSALRQRDSLRSVSLSITSSTLSSPCTLLSLVLTFTLLAARSFSPTTAQQTHIRACIHERSVKLTQTLASYPGWSCTALAARFWSSCSEDN